MKNKLLSNRSNWTSYLMRYGFLLAALTTVGLTSAQTTFTIGNGTGTTGEAPINSNYGYTYSQQIYYASELIAAGSGPGMITKVRFYTTSGAPNNSNGWTVYLGNTAKTEFTTTSDWEAIGNLTQVFSGTVTLPSANNWMEITLTTPFAWDGTSNLIVAVDENVSGYGNVSYWRQTGSAVNRTIYYRSDGTNPNPATPPVATGRQLSCPNAQFVMTPTTDCATTTLAHANAATTVATVCENGAATLSLNNLYFYTGITYQWQFNDGTSGWNDIVGATGATYLADTLLISGDYQAVVGCATNSTTDISSEVTVTVNPNPDVVIDHTDVALCDGEPANLIASGADTYLWTPTTLLTPSATSASVNVIPAAITTYTVTGTITATGCTNTATAVITPLSLTRSTAGFSPAENCAPGSPITLSITDVPAEITSGGTWEYRFMAANGTTVLQDWSADAEYTFTPSVDSIYGFYYQMRSTPRLDNVIDSVYASIIVGFGSESVAITGFNCNSDGILEIVEPFGQVDLINLTEVYANPLSDLSTMTGFALANNAVVTGGRLVLTPSATSNQGYGTLTIPNFTAGYNNSMKVSFNMTADTPINTWGTGGADGICYSFGPDATPAGNGTGNNGKGTKLRLSFDAAGNSDQNNNQTGIYLVYGWTATNAFGPASTQTLAYSPNTALWKLQTDVPVELEINANGEATVTVAGQVIFDHIALPPSYLDEDVSTWKHLFSAATGGDALRQAVSNLSIEAGNLHYGITNGGSSTAPSSWQSGTKFEDLLPGEYDLWISKDEAGTCLKNIGTYEILNLNPVVELGNDTTLCENEPLTLNAGNPGATYVWSGNNVYTQTLDVTEAGSYIVYVTDPVGCLGIGTINVDYNEAPEATGIYAQGSFPMMSFSVLGAQNAATYDWNFGDGNSVQNGPASVSHYYTEDGTFTVTVTLTNDCGTTTETTSITIIDYTGVGENTIEGLEVYPNPSTSIVNISIPNAETSEYRVFSISGAEVVGSTAFNSNTKVDVSAWESGVYFLTVTNGGITTTQKVVVE